MLASILPGLRELRVPLVCGYISLLAAWLAFSDRLPHARPLNGSLAAVWDVGGYLGKPAIIGAMTFVAYLVGAVLEFDPQTFWRSRGVPSAISALNRLTIDPVTVNLSAIERERPTT